MRKMFSRSFFRLYFFLLLVAMAILFGAYILSKNTLEKIDNKIVCVELDHVKNFATNIKNALMSITDNNPELFIEKDKNIKTKIDRLLSLFVTKQYKYVYIVHQDGEGLFRYLSDGTKDPTQKGKLNQPFFPQHDIWQKAVATCKPQYALQDSYTSLWLTYLYPITCRSGKTVILAFDISLKEYDMLFSLIKPMQSIIFYAILSIIIILCFSFFQTYLYFRAQIQSKIDSLTKLYNRNYLNSIKKKIELKKVSILMVDIDFFKSVNDRYGHDTGDVVLAAVAKRLLGSVREFDKVIRYGGEEFLIILEHQTQGDSKDISYRILKSVSKMPIRAEKHNIYITISIGVNQTPYKDGSLSKAIKRADKMLYEAKKRGRNRVVFDEVW